MSIRVIDTNYREPNIPSSQVQLELPSLRSLRSVTDRMKFLSKHMMIEGSMNGQMILRVEVDTVRIQTIYRQCKPRSDINFDENHDPRDNHDGDGVGSVRVDARHFCKALGLGGDATICCR